MKAFQYSRNVTAPDTLIVCAKPDNFASVFVAKRGWYPVRLDDAKLPRIRWVAVYLTQPVRAITHRAKVKSISKYEDSGKYRIDFEGEPEPLARPLEPGAIGKHPGTTLYHDGKIDGGRLHRRSPPMGLENANERPVRHATRT